MVPIRNLTTLNLRHSRRIDLILAVDYTSVLVNNMRNLLVNGRPVTDVADTIYKLAQEKLLNSKYDFTQLCATTEYAIALINNCLVGEGTPYVI